TVIHPAMLIAFGLVIGIFQSVDALIARKLVSEYGGLRKYVFFNEPVQGLALDVGGHARHNAALAFDHSNHSGFLQIARRWAPALSFALASAVGLIHLNRRSLQADLFRHQGA